MKKILTKVISFLVVLSVLSTCVFADDLTILDGEQFNTFGTLTAEDYGVETVSWAASFIMAFSPLLGSGTISHTFALSDSSSSDKVSQDGLKNPRLTASTLAIPAGTLSVSFSSNISSASSSASGVTVSYSGSSLTVVSDGSTSPITVSMTFKSVSGLSGYTVSASFVSSDPDPDPDPDPVNPYEGSGSMFGWTGASLLYLALNSDSVWYYPSGSGSSGEIGFMDASWVGMDGEGTLRGGVMNTKMLASLCWNKWKWEIDKNTGLPKFTVDSWSSGSWADMIYRTQVYNYFWGNKLWSNDVSGSWYGSISSSFSYLNYRVNQILAVLANDEDLEIKDSTTEERNWVKDYFTGSGDKADCSKYDDLNNTGSAFKDVFAGAPDTSIADGFTSVNDNGYDFWSQSVSDDINGSAISSFSSASAVNAISDDLSLPLDSSQVIVDAFFDNWEQIVGGYYD